MESKKEYHIINEVKSLTNSKIVYAKAGDKVSLVYVSNPAVVVMNSKNERFSTTLNNLK